MRIARRLLPLLFVVTIPAVGMGQAAMPQTNSVMWIYRESVKVGKGYAHDAHENAWARALVAAKYADNFIALTSRTGPHENWYISTYPTWAAYEKANDANYGNAAQSAVDKQFRSAEGDYLNDSRGMTLRQRDELSYGGPADLPNMRFVTVTRVSVRPGHTAEYEEARAMIKAAHERAKLSDRFSVWEVSSGAPAGTFYTFVARKSLAELDDAGTIHGAAYQLELGGAEGQKKLAALNASAVISQETDHFEFAPSQSVAPEAWVTANPGYWKPKAAAPAKKAAAPKP
jgi:hypothetical protein